MSVCCYLLRCTEDVEENAFAPPCYHIGSLFLSCNNLASYWLCSSCRITVTAKSPSTRGRKTGNPPDSCVRSQILAPVRAMCVRGSVFVNKDHWVRMGYPSMPSHMPVIQRGKPSSAQRGETLKSPPQKKSGTRDVSLRPWAPGDARVLSAPCWRPAAHGLTLESVCPAARDASTVPRLQAATHFVLLVFLPIYLFLLKPFQ